MCRQLLLSVPSNVLSTLGYRFELDMKQFLIFLLFTNQVYPCFQLSQLPDRSSAKHLFVLLKSTRKLENLKKNRVFQKTKKKSFKGQVKFKEKQF